MPETLPKQSGSRVIPWLLLLLAASTSVWAASAWLRLRNARAQLNDQRREAALVQTKAGQLAELRTHMGSAGPASSGDLVSFIESCAVMMGIPRESVSLSAEAPQAEESRSGMTRQQSRIAIDGAAIRSIVRLLGAVESAFPDLVVRELDMTPVRGGAAWVASARLVRTWRGQPGAEYPEVGTGLRPGEQVEIAKGETHVLPIVSR